MGRIIFLILASVIVLVSFCVGQGERTLNDESKISLGIINGLNYVIYFDNDWSEKTTSAPRISIGINSRIKLSHQLSNVFELSYLRLFYNTKHNYWDTSSVYEDRITFNNIYVSSELGVVVLRKGVISSNIGIGLAYVWPFAGTWDIYALSYKNVNNCRTWFFLGTIGLEIDKYPFSNSILKFAFDGHYYPLETFAPQYVSHPFVWRKGVAISESIPLRFTLSLFWKM